MDNEQKPEGADPAQVAPEAPTNVVAAGDAKRDDTSVAEAIIRQLEDLGDNKNENNQGLGMIRGPGFVIGHVDSVNGLGARPCPGYVATRHELLELARYWINELLEVETFWFFYAQTGSDDWRTKVYASERLDRIAEAVGKEAVEEVVSQVKNEFRRRMGDRHWEIFQGGSEEDYDRVREEIYAEEKDTPRVPGYAVDYLQQEAVRIFPEVAGGVLASALRMAADSIEAGHVTVVPCDHDWQLDGERKPGGPTIGGFVHAFEQCHKCRAIRERNIYPDDHGYEEAHRLADMAVPGTQQPTAG